MHLCMFLDKSNRCYLNPEKIFDFVVIDNHSFSLYGFFFGVITWKNKIKTTKNRGLTNFMAESMRQAVLPDKAGK